jgi:membrane protein implicated in regulation of membrane protease activity
MGAESIILGVFMILVGVALFFANSPISISIIFVIIGVFLIIFWKAEDKVEQRKDLKIKKGKK